MSLKDAQQLRVPVLPEQKRAIEANARAAGLPVAAFLRRLGLNHAVTGIVDQRAVAELARINGDLGRLGGLLKLWLTTDDKLTIFADQADVRLRVLKLLQRIIATQQELQTVMQRVIAP